MRRAQRVLVAVTIVFIMAAGGCGYTTRAYVGPHQSVYIAPFKNNIDIATSRSEYANYVSYYPLLESAITNAVVDRFIFDGSFSVVKEAAADVIIRGELTSYIRGPLRYAENNEDVTEYRVSVVANVEYVNNKTGELIWKQTLAGDSSYYTTGTQAKSEKTALDSAITDLARRVVEAVVEAW